MSTIIIETEGDALDKIVAFLTEQNVRFKTKKRKEKPYNPAFVKKVLERSKNAKKGDVIVYNEDLKKELFGHLCFI